MATAINPDRVIWRFGIVPAKTQMQFGEGLLCVVKELTALLFASGQADPKELIMINLTEVITSDGRTIETLTAFVLDAEHDILSVVTALQAHIDLLHDEFVRNHIPAERFGVLDQAMARLISDTTDLASVSELARAPRSKQPLMLETLMHEIAAETRSAFSKSQVSLSCEIAKGTTLLGDAVNVKTMVTKMVMSLLQRCRVLETLKIVGLTHNKRVSLSFSIGLEANNSNFRPWRLGELRLLSTNGEGIGLSAVDAMARLHHGQLSVSELPKDREGYRLTFRI